MLNMLISMQKIRLSLMTWSCVHTAKNKKCRYLAKLSICYFFFPCAIPMLHVHAQNFFLVHCSEVIFTTFSWGILYIFLSVCVHYFSEMLGIKLRDQMRLLDSIHSHFNANLKGRAYATMLISIIVISILNSAQKKLSDKMHFVCYSVHFTL